MMRRLLVPTIYVAALGLVAGVWFATRPAQPVVLAALPTVPALPAVAAEVAEPRSLEIEETVTVTVPTEEAALRPDFLLLATTVAPMTPERSRAHVLDRTSNSRYVLGLEQQVAGYDHLRLVEIDDARVVFDYAGERLEVFLDPDANWPEDPTVRPAPVKLTELLSLMKPQQEGESDEAFLERYEHGIGKLYRMELGLRTNKALFEQGVFAPKKEGGRQVGFYASRINKGSFWDTLGLEAGDVIVEINGIPIEGPESNRDAVKEVMRSETKIQLTVRRGDDLFETRTATLPVESGIWSDEPPVEMDLENS